MMPYMSDTVVCFDLDDTLYKEIDFVRSAYKEVANRIGHPEAAQRMLNWYYEGKDVFLVLIEEYGLDLTKADCINIYRNHIPFISLEEGVKETLSIIKSSVAKVGLITDGRSCTQRNKIKSLGLDSFFDIMVISEEIGSTKSDPRNFQLIMKTYPDLSKFIYVGDNPSKDFETPIQLGWKVFCLLNDGRNIHPQHSIDSYGDFIIKISSLSELIIKMNI